MYKLQLKDNPDRGLWLVGEKIRLGTSNENEMVLDGLGIEEFHAQILVEADRVVLQSLGSTCYVNDLPVVSDCALNSDDEIRIGQQRLVILNSRKIDELKQASKLSTPKVEVQETISVTTGWSIVTDHPQLKNNKYLISESATFGRGQECNIVIPYKLLSREHAKFTVDKQGLLLTDLGSSNGTFVNGKRIKEARLKGGDSVSFAKLSFTVQSPPGGATQAPVDDELNRTMIRPALNMDIVLKQTQEQEDQQDEKLSLEIETEPVSQDESIMPTNTEKSGVSWWVLAMILIATAVGCWLLLSVIK